MSLIRDEDRCCHINGILTLVSFLSLIVTIVRCWCYAFSVLCCACFCIRCFALTTLWSLGSCAIRVWVCALFCASILSSNVAFWTELRANRFLQSKNIWQPANDGANTTMSKDKVWRLQHLLLKQTMHAWPQDPAELCISTWIIMCKIF